jgi:hypothetical protein
LPRRLRLNSPRGDQFTNSPNHSIHYFTHPTISPFDHLDHRLEHTPFIYPRSLATTRFARSRGTFTCAGRSDRCLTRSCGRLFGMNWRSNLILAASGGPLTVGLLLAAAAGTANSSASSNLTPPPAPRPFDPRIDRLATDSTAHLNLVGRPGVVLPNLCEQRAKSGLGGQPWLASCGPQPSSATSVTTAAVSPRALCETLLSGRLAGDQVQLVAVYESTAHEIALWQETGMGTGGSRAGPGMSPMRSHPPGETVVSCYFDGVFTYRGHLPQGGNPPVFERMQFLFDGAGNLFQERGGSKAHLPLVRPAP